MNPGKFQIIKLNDEATKAWGACRRRVFVAFYFAPGQA
jgi:hypothetical protein